MNLLSCQTEHTYHGVSLEGYLNIIWIWLHSQIYTSWQLPRTFPFFSIFFQATIRSMLHSNCVQLTLNIHMPNPVLIYILNNFCFPVYFVWYSMYQYENQSRHIFIIWKSMWFLLVFRGNKLKSSLCKYVSYCVIKICFTVTSHIPKENGHIIIRWNNSFMFGDTEQSSRKLTVLWGNRTQGVRPWNHWGFCLNCLWTKLCQWYVKCFFEGWQLRVTSQLSTEPIEQTDKNIFRTTD